MAGSGALGEKPCVPDPASAQLTSSPAAPQAVASKSPLASRTIIGVLIALLPVLARWTGVQLDDADAQASADDLVTIAGAVLAIVGRWKATRPLALQRDDAAKLALLIFPALVFTGCAGLQVRAALPVGDGKASVAIDGKSVVVGYDAPRVQFRTSPPELRP